MQNEHANCSTLIWECVVELSFILDSSVVYVQEHDIRIYIILYYVCHIDAIHEFQNLFLLQIFFRSVLSQTLRDNINFFLFHSAHKNWTDEFPRVKRVSSNIKAWAASIHIFYQGKV